MPNRPLERERLYPRLNERQQALADDLLANLERHFNRVAAGMNLKPQQKSAIKDAVISDMAMRSHLLAAEFNPQKSQWKSFVSFCFRRKIADKLSGEARNPAAFSRISEKFDPDRGLIWKTNPRSQITQERLEQIHLAIEAMKNPNYRQALHSMLQGHTRAQVEATGLSWQNHQKRVSNAMTALARQMGETRRQLKRKATKSSA